MTEQNQESQEVQNNQEPQYEQVIAYCDPILLNTENVEDLQLDEKEFNKGLKDSSYIAGFVTGLVNSGWDLDSAINYVFAQLNSDMNISMSEINCKATIESSKNTSIIMDKQQV